MNLLLFFHWMLAEEKVTRAGQRVGLSQPAASRALRNLREIFNDELFIRNGRALTPTRFAKDMAPQLETAISAMRDAIRTDTDFDPAGFEGQIVFASNDYLAAVGQHIWQAKIFPQAVHARTSWRPLTPSVIEGLISGEIDAVFMPDTPEVNIPKSAVLQDMVRRPFIKDRFVIFGAKTNPIFLKQMDMSAYLAAQHVLVSPAGKGEGIVDKRLKAMGLERRVATRCYNFHLAAQIAVSSDAVTVIPKRLADILSGGAYCDLHLDVPPLASVMVWHASRTQDPVHGWMRGHFLGDKNLSVRSIQD